MAMAARQALAARRNEKRVFAVQIVGMDLTDVAAAAGLRMQVRLRPDTPGAALIDLATVTNANAEGLRLSDVTVTDGVPTSTITVTINKSTMSSAASLPYSGEVGDDSRLAYALQIDGSTRLFGDFWALASTIDSDAAPLNRPIDFAPQARAPGQWYATTLTIADQEVISVTIDGVDAVAPYAAKAVDAAARAAVSSATAESAAGPTYASVADGEAATAAGESFAVDNGDGTVTIYLRTGGGSTAQRTLATTDYLSSPDGAGAIGTSFGSNVDDSLQTGGVFTAPGAGGQRRPTADHLLESSLHVTDYGAPSDGGGSVRAGLLAATAAARQPAFTDGPGRAFSKRIHLPSGRYTLDDIASLANSTGTVGLVVSGDGATEIDFTGSAATIKVIGSRRILFKDLVFKSSGVDDNQVAFTIANSTGDGSNPLVGWQFWNCEFSAFYKCFDVSGNQMCSEFVFFGCKFSNCYRLKQNSNVQAVNWSFYGCDWDNNSLSTSKDKTLSAIFYLAAGNKVNWFGGSIICYGRWVLYDLKSAGLVQRVAHSVHFTGPRVELMDEGGSHVPLIDRIDSGYINGTNQPAVTIEDIEDIKLGTIGIGNDIVIARVWANCSLTIRDCHSQTCHVAGVIDSQTATAGAQVLIENCSGIGYQEDTAARVSDHDQHNVRIRPNNVSAGTAIDIDQRGCSLGVPVSLPVKRLRLRGPTGSIPQGGTTINLPAFPPHTEILAIGFERFGTAAQSLTGDIRDQADTTSYGSVTAASGANTGMAKVNKEVGFQIPAGTALMAKFTGTPEVVKGFFYIDYQ